MAVAKQFQGELGQYVALAIVIVVGVIVLAKFKSSNVGNMTCPAVGNTVYDAANDKCCLSLSNCAGANTTAIGDIAATSNSFASGIDEPANWIAIIIISIIGIAILKMFNKKQ